VKTKKDIYNPNMVESVSYFMLAFLDNTELISDNIPAMSKKLSVCTSFYEFTYIEANLNKTVMITNDISKVDKNEFIDIDINGI